MNRLYENYLSDHAGYEDASSLGLVLDRDLLAMIPSRSARCLDLGCGQGVCRPTFVSEAFERIWRGY